MKKQFIFVVVAALASAAIVSAMPNMGQNPEIPVLDGEALEVLQAGSYTYIRLKTDKKIEWYAVPMTEVKKGARIKVKQGFEMKDFKSKILKRTFKSVMFSGGVVDGGEKAAVKKPAGDGDAKSEAKMPEKVKAVEKAAGKDAYTVADIHKMSEELNGKTVVVRGRVVKVSTKILGRNWIHLQDGTGDMSKKTHDLLVTTQDLSADSLPKVDDIATYKGIALKDQNFGSGYAYPVLLERAELLPPKP